MGPSEDELLAAAREWFDGDGQVEHYRAEAVDGPTAFEREVLRALPRPPADVLDVGCGAGRIAVPLALQGYRVTGVDVSDRLLGEAVDFAAEQGATLGFERVSATRLPFPDRSFDAVVSIKHYCYLPGTSLRRSYLAGLAKLLRPGGTLVLTSYVVPSEAEAQAVLDADPQHRSAAARYRGLEPLDTFSAGSGYVHWFTVGQLIEELSLLGPAATIEADDGLQVGLITTP